MQLFWQLGKAFPKEIIAYLKAPVPPYNTVLSTIRKLEKEGYLTFRKFGKSHQYYPIIQREDASRSIFKNCMTSTCKETRWNYFHILWKKKKWMLMI